MYNLKYTGKGTLEEKKQAVYVISHLAYELGTQIEAFRVLYKGQQKVEHIIKRYTTISANILISWAQTDAALVLKSAGIVNTAAAKLRDALLKEIDRIN